MKLTGLARRPMSVLYLLLVGVIGAFGCAPTQPTGPASLVEPAASCRCFDGIGSNYGDKPALTLAIDNNPKLVVCGYIESSEPGALLVMSEFDVFDCASGQSLATYSALDECTVATEGDRLIVTELAYLPTGTDWQRQPNPIARRTFSIATSNIVTSREVAFVAARLSQSSVDTLLGELTGLDADVGAPLETWNLVFDKLLVCALAGYSSCEDRLTAPSRYFGGALDGAAAEAQRRALSHFQFINTP